MRYDVVIVGGGLVGTSLAIALRNSDLKVALIDARMPSQDDQRLFALNSTSCQFLKNIDSWPALLPHAAPIRRVHVSRKGHFGAVRLHSDEAQLAALGYVIPARFIEAALHAQVEAVSNVTLYRPAKLLSLLQDNTAVTLEVDHGDQITIQASWVVGADGTASTVREQAGIPVQKDDRQQSALVTRIGLTRAHSGVAYERFTPDGAIAMLPLPGHECASIWSSRREHINELMALTDAEYLERLQETFGHRLGRLQSVAKRYSYPLHVMRAERSVSGRVILIGNAAHTLHPIAAQGFNLALYEVAVLVEELRAKTFSSEGFNARVKRQQDASIGVSQRLSHVFSGNQYWMQSVAQLGMIGLDMAFPLKTKLIKTLLGSIGRVPALLLGRME